MLNRLSQEPDIICITETKLNELVPDSDQSSSKAAGQDPNIIKLPGYKFYHTVSTTNAGGAGLYVSNKCKYKIRHDLDLCIDDM